MADLFSLSGYLVYKLNGLSMLQLQSKKYPLNQLIVGEQILF